MKSIKSMTPGQLQWLYMLYDEEHYHFDYDDKHYHFKFDNSTTDLSSWMDMLACRIADAAGGYAKKNFDPTKIFIPDPKLLAKYPGCLNWSKNPSFPPKAWNQIAMSWTHRSPLPQFEDYLQQRLKVGSFVIDRHMFWANTLLNSKRATPSNLNKLINDIASKPNNFWVIFDPAEARTVENTFKNNSFNYWCKLTNNRDGDGDYSSGMWGTFHLFNFSTFGTNLSRALNDPIDGPQILAQGFLYAFYG